MINTPFSLPCGAVLKNRLVKAAMTERIANLRSEPVEGLKVLYDKFANSGAGLLITGNVMVDRVHLESAGNVCFDDESILPELKKWAEAGKTNDTHIWVQISHAGRQTNRFNTLRPKAPSPVQLKKLGLFGKPREMTQTDIEKVIQGFKRAAKLTKKAGFTGIQIHAAHGYLLSQFLSPLTNLRKDKWGGSLKNRSRLLLEVIKEVREEVGKLFPISVKLNSSDFQRGGFTQDESLEVIRKLDEAGIDLLEISGGTYEKLAFFLLNDENNTMRESTRQREAYFMDFALKVRQISRIPLMITGGFRSFDFCSNTLEKGELDLIGMARPFVTNIKDIPSFLKGKTSQLENLIIRAGSKQLNDTAEGGYYARQLIRLSKNKTVNPKVNPVSSSLFLMFYEFRKAMARKSLFRR